MVLNYTRLFNLRLRHSFYTNGVPLALTLKPTVTTSARLRSGRMLMKPLNDGITVLYESQDDELTPRVRLQEPFVLTFALYAGYMPQFLNITDLRTGDGSDFERGMLLRFSIDTGFTGEPETFTHTFLNRLRSSRFVLDHTPDEGGSGWVFTLHNQNGEIISAGRDPSGEPLPGEILLTPDDQGKVSQQVTMDGRQPGVYSIRLTSEDGNEVLFSEPFFMDPVLTARPPLGIVQVRLHSYPDTIGTQEYLLQFSAKSAHWRYYVMNRSGKVIHEEGSLESLSINRGESSEFPEEIGFDRLEDEAGEEIRIDDFDTAVFRSSLPVPFRERPFTGLELTNDEMPVLRHLPNPSPSASLKQFGSDHESETFIYI